jgi:hypothetical protein
VPCGRFEILSLRQSVPKASVGDVTSGFWAAIWVAFAVPNSPRILAKASCWELILKLQLQPFCSKEVPLSIVILKSSQFRINSSGSSQAGFKCTLFQQGSRNDFPCPCWRLWMNGKRGGTRGRLNGAFAKRAGPLFSVP